jgi:xylulokinase
MYWLGIDVGTGGTRALLVDRQGRVKAGFTAPHEDMRLERPLWAEQRPENGWDAGHLAIRAVDTTVPEPAQGEVYARGHQVYRALHPALRPLCPRM